MSSYITYCITCRNECKSLSKNFIISFHTDKHHCHMEGTGSTNTNYRFLGSCIGSHIILKAVHKFTYTGNESSIDTLFQILLLVSHKLRNTQRDKFLCSIKFMNERNYFFIHDIFL